MPSMLQTHGLVHCAGNILPDAMQIMITLGLSKGSGYKTLLIQVHFNNVDGVKYEYDALMMGVCQTSEASEHMCGTPDP
jgi:hypothetical protein